MKYIQNVYSKYVEFDKRRSLIQFKRKTEKKTRDSKDEGVDSNESSEEGSQQDDFLYASVILYVIERNGPFRIILAT